MWIISFLCGLFVGILLCKVYFRNLGPTPLISNLDPAQVKKYVEKKGWYLLKIETGFLLYEHLEYPRRMLMVPRDPKDVGFSDVMSDVVRRLSEVEKRDERYILLGIMHQ